MSEKAIVVGVGLKTDSLHEIKESLLELEELAYAAGAEVVGSLTQVTPKYNPATLIGTGKVDEVADLVKNTDSKMVIIDHQLSGAQLRNLEEVLEVKVLVSNRARVECYFLWERTTM